jgi:hypothetical protein
MARTSEVLALVSTVPEVRPSRSMIEDPAERAAVMDALHAAFGATRRHEGWMPAPQPVSLDADGLATLRERRADYLCTLKADGSRFVLVMLNVGDDSLAVMVSRKLEMYEVSVVAQPHHFLGTVLDGELVATEGGLQYLVFDAIRIKGQSLLEVDLTERMRAVYQYFEVYNVPAGAPAQDLDQVALEQDKVVPLVADTPLKIVAKRWWVPGELGRMWAERQQLGVQVDGIVLMRRRGIVPGTDRTMFKWKSSHTVDLALGDVPMVAVSGELRPAAEALAEYVAAGRKRGRAPKSFNIEHNQLVEVLMRNRSAVPPVVECEILLTDVGVLMRPVKERPDKTMPNDVSTVHLTIRGVGDAIDLTRLSEACEAPARHVRQKRG